MPAISGSLNLSNGEKMTQVSGSLSLVTGSPAGVSQVWLRAPNGRVQGNEYVTESPDTVQVTGGAVSFDALPGALVMTLVSHGAPLHTVKLLVPDKSTATLAECIEAAELATDGTRNALERLALEVQAELGQVPALVSDALAQDATIIDAVEQASAVVLEDKADKSYVDQQDQTLGQRTGIVPVRNAGTSLLSVGKAVSAVGSDGGVILVGPWDQASQPVGVLTSGLPPGESGEATVSGYIEGLNTSLLTPGALVYIGIDGLPTMTQTDWVYGTVVTQGNPGSVVAYPRIDGATRQTAYWRGSGVILPIDGQWPTVDTLAAGAYSVGGGSAAVAMGLPALSEGSLHVMPRGSSVAAIFIPVDKNFLGQMWTYSKQGGAAYGWTRIDGTHRSLDEWWAPAPESPLTIPTHEGSGQATHPSVLRFDSPWSGYRYWMAFTTYPWADNAHEDPCVVASHNGTDWVVPNGLVNPLDDAPGSVSGGSYNSDTAIFMRDGVMYVLWREVEPNANQKLWWRTSTDGVTWTEKHLVWQGGMQVLSPSVEWLGDKWRMYFNRAGAMYYHESTAVTPTTEDWGAAVTCTVSPVPSAMWQWHSEIRKVGTRWWGLIMMSPQGRSDGGVLYMAKSVDGLNWTVSEKPLIPLESKWHISHYRSAFVASDATLNPDFDVWYVGVASDKASHIARTRATRLGSGQVARWAEQKFAASPKRATTEATLINDATGRVILHREGDLVTVTLEEVAPPEGQYAVHIAEIPTGFRPPSGSQQWVMAVDDGWASAPSVYGMYSTGYLSWARSLPNSSVRPTAPQRAELTYRTPDTMPTV